MYFCIWLELNKDIVNIDGALQIDPFKLHEKLIQDSRFKIDYYIETIQYDISFILLQFSNISDWIFVDFTIDLHGHTELVCNLYTSYISLQNYIFNYFFHKCGSCHLLV